MEQVLQDIQNERKHQDKKWGGPSHDDQHDTYDFLGFIDDYVGLARRALDRAPLNHQEIRKRMIQVGALAVAAVESFDRRYTHNNRTAADCELDCGGLHAPLPILRAKKALSGMQSGEHLHIKFSSTAEPGDNADDIRNFCIQTGNFLIGDISCQHDQCTAIIRKA